MRKEKKTRTQTTRARAHTHQSRRDEDKSHVLQIMHVVPNHERKHLKMPCIYMRTFLSMLFDKWQQITQHKNTSSKRIESTANDHTEQKKKHTQRERPTHTAVTPSGGSDREKRHVKGANESKTEKARESEPTRAKKKTWHTWNKLNASNIKKSISCNIRPKVCVCAGIAFLPSFGIVSSLLIAPNP